MTFYRYPDPGHWPELCRRPVQEMATIRQQVEPVVQQVQQEGDAALLRLTQQFDGVRIESVAVPPEQIRAAATRIAPELAGAIRTAIANLRRFHIAQKEDMPVVETMPGVRCWRKSVAIERVGLYVPAGSSPLFSTVLMLAVPARLAGCSEVVLCTPPGPDGAIDPAILFCAHELQIDRVFRVGGAQAVAAMAFGTETIPAVDKIFGPGNQYVTAAKQLVALDGVAIDLPAGPSEVLIIADSSARADFIAADLLSQAEHGPDSQVLLLTDSQALADEVERELEQQLANLPRRDIATQALRHSRLILLHDLETMLAFANAYAPEHLILMLEKPADAAERVRNAGSVFLGHFTPEAAGDYASGTNHTLPTNGHARTSGGVSLDSFVKKITFQQISAEGMCGLAPVVETMAAAEGLHGHARAAAIRRRAAGGEHV